MIADSMTSCPFCGAMQNVNPIQTEPSIAQNINNGQNVQPANAIPVQAMQQQPVNSIPTPGVQPQIPVQPVQQMIPQQTVPTQVPVQNANVNATAMPQMNMAQPAQTVVPQQVEQQPAMQGQPAYQENTVQSSPIPENQEANRTNAVENVSDSNTENAPKEKPKKGLFGRKKKKAEEPEQDEIYYKSTEPEVKDSWTKSIGRIVVKVVAVGIFVGGIALYLLYLS